MRVVNYEALKSIKCKNCGCETFIEVFSYRIIPKYLSVKGKDEIVPVYDVVCLECGESLEFTEEEEKIFAESIEDSQQPFFTQN